MSWLRKLFGTHSEGSQDEHSSNDKVIVESFGGHIVSVPQMDMMGQMSTSPNERYQLIWQDTGWNRNDADPRGRYVLIEGGKLIADGRMERPHDGKVADDGTFILNDWGDRGDLVGIFNAFDITGNPIISRSFAANLLNNGLSTDGHLAVCQTCNAPNSPDSSVLSVFDLIKGVVVAAWQPESGWADSYEFPADNKSVRIIRRDRMPIHYSLNGDFLDRQKWLHDECGAGNIYVIRKALAEGEDRTGISISDLRGGIQIALENNERNQAEALRLLGEIEEADGDLKAAVQAYEQALDKNPKIGVARRTAKLKKTLAG